MFCENCGKPVDGEQKLCSACAAEQSAQEQAVVEQSAPEQAVVEQSAPEQAVVEQPVPVADPAPVADNAPKKKRGLIGAIVALGIVVAAAVAIVLNLNAINGFIGRTFKAPEVYFADVERAAISEYTYDLTQSYGKSLANYNNTQTAGKMDIQLTMGDELMDLAESALQQQGASMDLDWLRTIALSVDANVQEEVVQMALGLALGSQDLLTADMIVDADNGMTYMAIPELNDQYLSVDMSSSMDIDEFKVALEQSQKMRESMMKALPSEKALYALISTYTDIVLEGINTVERETDIISVGNESQKVVVLSAKISQNDLLDIAEDILKEAEKDEALESILKGFGDYVNEMGELNGNSYFEPVDLYQEFVDSIPQALEELDNARQDTNDDNYLILNVYVDMKNQIRGHELFVYSDGEKTDTAICWMTVEKHNVIYTEAQLGGVEITGEKTEKKGISEGYYDLTVSDQKLGKLEFENVTETSGTLCLIPSEELMSTLLDGSGIPASLLGDNIALELIYSTEGDTKGSFEANVLMGSKKLIGIALSSEITAGGEISIPTNTVDVQDQAALMQWVQGADFDAVLDNLEKAGLPDYLLSSIRYYTDMIN